jgi:subtilisin family serine protease
MRPQRPKRVAHAAAEGSAEISPSGESMPRDRKKSQPRGQSKRPKVIRDRAVAKLHPKVRMVRNGSTTVNVLRAELASAIAVTKEEREGVPVVRGDREVRVRRRLPKSVTPGRLREDPQAKAHVFIHLVDGVPEDARLHPGQSGRRSNIVAATVRLSEIPELAERADVAYIELGEPLDSPTPDVSDDRPRSPSLDIRRFGTARRHHGGKGVLIGIIDVGGFDFAHPDFLDADGSTRFEKIWDQGGRARPPPGGEGLGAFDYGAEFSKEHLNRAIREASKVKVPPQELEPQSQMAVASHGTHVASIAAGGRGICREAHLAGVLISLASEDAERRGTFSDSTRITHAVEYLLRVAHDLGNLPVSINVSLGTNGHAHDGSSAVSRWIDAAVSAPGRSVSVAAGNAGQEIAAFEGDIGYVMGRIHTSGRLAGAELFTDLEWVVVGNGIVDVSENELELWFSPQDRFAVDVKPPGGDWIGPVEPRQFVENQQLPDGSLLSVYNEVYHPANGANYISVYLSPFLSPDGVVGVPAGEWKVRLTGREIRDGRYHGWIERDDPRRLGRVGTREAWRFPSFFSARSLVDDSTASSLASGNGVISVANLDAEAERIHLTSSQGPTRDGRFKPEIAAPGTDIVAAKGFAGQSDLWVAMTGTSMASPFVTGVAGLMLATEPRLTAAQIAGIIQRTAKPLPGADYTWRNDAGFGVIDPQRCLEEAARATDRQDLTR